MPLNIKSLKIVVRCEKCGRPLRSAKSIARGMGAVCAGESYRKGYRKRKDNETIDMFEPVYSCQNCFFVYDQSQTKKCPNCGVEKSKGKKK